MRKTIIAILCAELLVMIAVMLLFANIADRLTAGLIAGTLFVALGLFIAGAAVKFSALRRTPLFYVGLIHLLLSALPMWLTRLLNQSADFSQVKVMGLSGPLFHQVSEAIYLVLIVSTLVTLRMAKREPSKTLTAN